MEYVVLVVVSALIGAFGWLMAGIQWQWLGAVGAGLAFVALIHAVHMMARVIRSGLTL